MSSEYPPEFEILKERYKIFTHGTYNQNRLSCNKCKDIMIQPIQTECGCRFCKNCIFNTKDHCPECNEKWRENIQIPDRATEKEITTSTVRCQNPSCSQEHQLKDWQNHRKDCQHQNQKCPNQCKENIEDNLETHLVNCKRTPIKCPLNMAGCKSILPKEELNIHLQDKMINHTELLMIQYHKLEEETEDLEMRRKEIIAQEKHMDNEKRKSQEIIQQLCERITQLENIIAPRTESPKVTTSLPPSS